MKLSLSKENGRININGIIRSVIFFSAYYLYLWLYVNPEQNQDKDDHFYSQQ